MAKTGRKHGSKDRLERTQIEYLRPKLVKVMERILDRATNAKAIGDMVRAFTAVAPYILKTADKEGNTQLTDAQLVDALRLLANAAALRDSGQSGQPSNDSPVQDE